MQVIAKAAHFSYFKTMRLVPLSSFTRQKKLMKKYHIFFVCANDKSIRSFSNGFLQFLEPGFISKQNYKKPTLIQQVVTMYISYMWSSSLQQHTCECACACACTQVHLMAQCRHSLCEIFQYSFKKYVKGMGKSLPNNTFIGFTTTSWSLCVETCTYACPH